MQRRLTFKELRVKYPKKAGETAGKYRQRLALLMSGQDPQRQPSNSTAQRKVVLRGADPKKEAPPWAAVRK